MGNSTRRIAFLLLLVLVSIITVSITGCEANQTDYQAEASEPGCRILNVKNKLVSFSFEYSTYYKKEGPILDTEHGPPATYFSLYAPRKEMKIMVPDFDEGGDLKTVSASYCPAAIVISVFATLPDESNARERIDGWVSMVEEEGYSESLERSPVVVSGIDAEMLDFIRDSGMLLAVDKKIEYNRVVYFDYGGYIWSFMANSDEELAEKVKTDFDHIIETFKIIYVNQP